MLMATTFLQNDLLISKLKKKKKKKKVKKIKKIKSKLNQL